MQNIEGVLYLNLAHRVDRKKRLEGELQRLAFDPQKVTRIEAHFDELNGHRGCAKSHALALDHALRHNLQNALILEDDCFFSKSRLEVTAYVETFLAFAGGNWDVLFLGGNLKSSEATAHPAYLRVFSCLNAHAYLVNGPYFARLRDLFLRCYESMSQDFIFLHSSKRALDVQWEELMRRDRWFIGKEPLAMQSRGYSDIEKRVRALRY